MAITLDSTFSGVAQEQPEKKEIARRRQAAILILNISSPWKMNAFLEKFLNGNKSMEFLHSLRIPPMVTSVRMNLFKESKEHIIKRLQEELDRQSIEKHWDKFQIISDGELEELLLIPCIKRGIPSFRSLEVIVDVECAQAVLRGADIFIPGILSMSPSIEVGELISVYVDLEGKCKKGTVELYKGKKEFIGNGICQFSRNGIFQGKNAPKSGVAIKMVEMEYCHPSLKGVLEDLIFVQNVPSLLTVFVLNPQPGMLVLDMCASPGGKTTHIAQKMKQDGIVLAFDKNKRKVEIIKKNAERFNSTIIRAVCMDSSKCINYQNGLCLPEDLLNGDIETRKLSAGIFDRILLDPPCSGIGQRPCLIEPPVPDETFSDFQLKLFRKAIELLKVGGEIVYSTCTVNPDENEHVIHKILNEFENMSLLPIKSNYGHGGLPIDPRFDHQKVKRFTPSKECDHIAFFMAHLRKIK